MDYCNALLTRIANTQVKRLQSIQNAAARLVSGARRRDHITPVLRSLHWVPVRRRIIFKTAVLVRKCIHGVVPAYLQEVCTPVESVPGRPRVRSASTGGVELPRVLTSTGQWSFSFHGPTVWNRLPLALRDGSFSLNTFTRHLLTVTAHHPEPLLRFVILAPSINFTTYFITYLWKEMGRRYRGIHRLTTT